MSRRFLRVLPLLLAGAASACVAPTAPTPPHLLAPNAAASFDDDLVPPTDTTCRSGYIVGQGHSC